MNSPSIFDTLLVWPIINILVLIYQLLMAAHIPYAFGFSLIFLTIVIRLLIYPFVNTQLKASRKMQELSPHLSRLKEKHKKDAKMIQQETMRLYKEHGVNPAAGCLPTLVQLPIIWALYTVLQHLVSLKPNEIVSYINNIVYSPSLRLTQPWDQYFFGLER